MGSEITSCWHPHLGHHCHMCAMQDLPTAPLMRNAFRQLMNCMISATCSVLICSARKRAPPGAGTMFSMAQPLNPAKSNRSQTRSLTVTVKHVRRARIAHLHTGRASQASKVFQRPWAAANANPIKSPMQASCGGHVQLSHSITMMLALAQLFP